MGRVALRRPITKSRAYDSDFLIEKPHERCFRTARWVLESMVVEDRPKLYHAEPVCVEIRLQIGLVGDEFRRRYAFETCHRDDEAAITSGTEYIRFRRPFDRLFASPLSNTRALVEGGDWSLPPPVHGPIQQLIGEVREEDTS